ncbi:phospholipase D-like domain-containing protein [Bdellovibrio bacteriovorus]|uniref:phospholipase D-like domain-containing protein n=1 Tax=Bdellovibrio bacteriovorus TaxID=959 RepID=UPI0009B714B9|nr:phosphatidylserine/phosphatidylglycerophosphate/cardiolipin synthase family protein [Bdellovibrio bacteriovorus]
MESWSQVQIFHSGDDFFLSLSQDIRQARRSVTIESYIFAEDKLTKAILQELTNARERGCTVKIVVDGFGSYTTIPYLDRFCTDNGLELRVFHPLPYPLIWAHQFVLKYSWRGSLLFKRLNRRTHRKIAIVDEKRAYLGSMNFTQEHCASFVGDKAWRDTGVWVEGEPVKRLVLAFQISYLRTFMKGLLTWVGRWRINEDIAHSVLRLNTTQRTRKKLYRDLLRRISHAENRIYLTTAYFLPRRSLLRALLKAAHRGVDVQLLIPGKSDVPMVKWAAFYIVRLLIQRQIPIFEYQKSILHAKTMIIDNEAFVGSFNLNHRSILHDLEVEVILKDPALLQNMLEQWHMDIENSKPASEKDFATPSWLTRILYKIAFRLRYML